jgi:hypothetical protein
MGRAMCVGLLWNRLALQRHGTGLLYGLMALARLRETYTLERVFSLSLSRKH